MDTLRIIDKLDKIGMEAVKIELKEIGLSLETATKIEQFINIIGSNDDILKGLKELKIENEEFVLGLDELSKVVYYIRQFGVPDKNFTIDLKIARGLDYYTGTVYETILNDYPSIGSVCSGGRYDNLAEYYTTQQLPGVGISIGLSRLFYQLKEAGFFKESISSTLTKVLVLPMDENISYSIGVSNELKKFDVVSEVYFEDGKFAKKLNYANKLGIPYVIIIGGDEIASEVLTLKDMVSGEQFKLTIQEIIERLR